jgi:hypothetical protein
MDRSAEKPRKSIPAGKSFPRLVLLAWLLVGSSVCAFASPCCSDTASGCGGCHCANAACCLDPGDSRPAQEASAPVFLISNGEPLALALPTGAVDNRFFLKEGSRFHLSVAPHAGADIPLFLRTCCFLL